MNRITCPIFLKSFLVFLICLVFLVPTIFASEAEEYKPYLHNPSVGDVPELESYGTYSTQLFTGSGSYSYSITVPPGVGGLEPVLSLSYSSHSTMEKPGILGSGWVLSENHIMRHVNNSVDDSNDDYFILLLGHSNLKLNFNGTTFKTEINPQDYKIQNLSNGGDQYWQVTSTDGTTFRFGYNDDSRLESNTGKAYDVKWSLDQIVDVHGNSIVYGYNEDPYEEDIGTVYLSNITYNNDQLKLVSFGYENQARPERRQTYIQGNLHEESRRLSDISIYFNESLVRRYLLEYDVLNDEKTISTLTNITYIGSDGSSVLNTVHFEYFSPTKGFDDTTSNWLVPSSFAFSANDFLKRDYGVRLLDVNNDGFPDLIRAQEGVNPHTTILNNKVDGWNVSSLFIIPSGIDITNTIGVDQGIRFTDVNSDGLIDILQAKKGGSRNTYLNNGTGWELSASEWSLPIDFINSASDDLGVRLTDLNGDGRMDLIKSLELSPQEVHMNNGSGWVNVSGWTIPEYFVTSDKKDKGLRILDLNNDGLPDLLKGGIPGNAWINNGSGWVNQSQYAPNLEFTGGDDRPDLGVRFMELNGDGLVDIIQNFYSNVTIEEFNETCFEETNSTENCTSYWYNITFDSNTKMNNGSGWVSGLDTSPEEFTDAGFNIGRRIADVNGDGYPDILVAYSGDSYESITHLKNTTSAFLLQQVKNVYGGIEEITYVQSTLSDNDQDLGFNMWLVGNATTNNTVNQGFDVNSENTYEYVGGKYDYANKEFLGFGEVNETLPDGSIISYYYLQDSIMKGRKYKQSVHDNGGSHFKDTINIYSHTSDNTITLDETATYRYDGNTEPWIFNTTYEYDMFGNIEQINNYEDVDIEGDEKFEEFNYAYNTTTYVVSKPANYTVYAADGTTVVKLINYYYDQRTTGVSLGDLTKTIKFNDIGEDPETQYQYDSYGNVESITDPRGHTTSFTYDSTGTVGISETNELGHTTKYTHDLGTGNPLSEIRDGLNKTYDYDIFGRITSETISPDTSISPTKKYTYSFDGVSPESIKIEDMNSADNYSESLIFYDGMGNVIQKKTLFDTDVQIVKNYFYDAKNRITAEQNPYLSAYAASLSVPETGSTTNYTYDGVDRIISVVKPDNTEITVVFNTSTISHYDENNNRIDYTIDGHGRITRVQEFIDGGGFNTSYFYRADDLLTNITDSLGNNFIFVFNTLGQRIAFDDSDVEPWNYVYDLNGNLVNQTDGRNVTTLMTYDYLNRLVEKWSPGGTANISLAYDEQINGTLSNITLISPDFYPIYYRYTYDDRLRIVKEDISVHPDENNPGDRYWINTTVEYDSQNRILNRYLPKQNLSYEYNTLGKMDKITNFLESINYNAFGKIENKTYANDQFTSIEYDELGRITHLETGSVQDLSYEYDATGNVKQINDTKNSKAYKMEYDALNRLTETILYDYDSAEHEKYTYALDSIGNLLRRTTDALETNFTFDSSAHAPSSLMKTDRTKARLELTTTYPTEDITVTQNQFFNYSSQICCRDNDCWGADVYLDPLEEGHTPTTETRCSAGFCNLIVYSGTRFVFEDERWLKIEDARSLKNVWDVEIELDERFPVEVIDYNYTSILLNVSRTNRFRLTSIPLAVYNKFNESDKPKDEEGKIKDKDVKLRVGRNEWITTQIDLSDTRENILSQQIKWGDASTIITLVDTTSQNMGDSYIASGGDADQNDGSNYQIFIVNTSYKQQHTLIKFNTSQIPRQALIENAQLNLWLESYNRLDRGESLNVSSHQIYHSFSWDEDTITWNTRPNTSEYNNTETDENYIFGGAGEPSDLYIVWDVTPIIRQKNNNESFYMIANAYAGSPSENDHLSFYSKEYSNPNKRPLLNITYLLKGLVSTNISETPFYTINANPVHVDLEQDECQNITWPVNATGEQRDYIFFAFANKTADSNMYGETDLVQVTIS